MIYKNDSLRNFGVFGSVHNINKEVFVKHKKVPTAPRFEGVLPISYMPMFWKITALAERRPKVAKVVKGTSTHQDDSFELIPRSLRPSFTKKQPGKAYVS